MTGDQMKNKDYPPRIGTTDWINLRDGATAVFNGAYDAHGNRLEPDDKPWTVIGTDRDWEHFATHAEALAYAFKENK